MGGRRERRRERREREEREKRERREKKRERREREEGEKRERRERRREREEERERRREREETVVVVVVVVVERSEGALVVSRLRHTKMFYFTILLPNKESDSHEKKTKGREPGRQQNDDDGPWAADACVKRHDHWCWRALDEVCNARRR